MHSRARRCRLEPKLFSFGGNGFRTIGAIAALSQPDVAIAPPIAVGGKGKYSVDSATKMNGNTQSVEEFPFCSRS